MNSPNNLAISPHKNITQGFEMAFSAVSGHLMIERNGVKTLLYWKDDILAI